MDTIAEVIHKKKNTIVECGKCKKRENELSAEYPVKKLCETCHQDLPMSGKLYDTWTYTAIFNPAYKAVWLCNDCSCKFYEKRNEDFYKEVEKFIKE